MIKLNKLINDYINLQKKEDELSSQKEYLKEEILRLMGDEKSYDTGNAKAIVTLAEGFKYNDKVGAVIQIKAHGYNKFITEEINTKELNSFIKGNPENPLSEALLSGKYLTKTNTTKLMVKEY